MRFEGKTALVTGGTSGIGLAIVRALRADGARVVALSRSGDRADSVREEFAGDALVTVETADVRDRASLERVRDAMTELHILVPNAGVNTRVKAVDLPDQPLRDMIETNLYGVFITCQVFAGLLLKQPGGKVVITSSYVAVHGTDLRVAYSATKAGLTGLVRSLAVEWGPLGANVNAVGPGVIETALTRAYMDQHPDRVQATIAHTPLRRLGTPDDIAGVVAFLASDAARFITGQTLIVDGGMSAGGSWW